MLILTLFGNSVWGCGGQPVRGVHVGPQVLQQNLVGLRSKPSRRSIKKK